MDFFSVKTKDELFSIENPQTGSIYYCEEDESEYAYDPNTNEWEKLEIMDVPEGNGETSNAEGGINLYQMNQMLVAQMPIMTDEKVRDCGGKLLEQFYCSAHKYYMLLCKDYNYYTVFQQMRSGGGEPFVSEVIDIIQSIGDVYSIEINDDGVLEFWIKPNDDATPRAFYLFPYDNGVIYFE